MNRTLRRALGVAVAGTAALAIAAGSRVSHTPPGAGSATVRLSWRFTGERVQECRKLSEEELASQPIHMRRPEVCEGRVLPYTLRLELDGRLAVQEIIEPSGARGDRPLYVHRELPIEPGTYRLDVAFERTGPARRDSVSRLELSTTVSLGPGDVVLVTYDPDRRALVARRSGSGGVPPL